MLSLPSRFVAVAGLLAACGDSIDDSCPPGTVPDGKVCAQPGGGAAGSAGGTSAGAAGATNGAGQAGAGAGGSSGAAGQVAGGGSSGAGGMAGGAGGTAGAGGAGAGGSGAGSAGASGASGLGGLAGAGGAAGGAAAGMAGASASAGASAGVGGTAGMAGGPSSCGNGFINDGEQCDGTNLGGYKDCHSVFPGYAGPLKCTGTCTFDTSGCKETLCGDGKVEGGEECDSGPEWESVTCSQLLGGNYSPTVFSSCLGCKFEYPLCVPLDAHHGPPMVAFSLTSVAPPIQASIHATEVTRAQYSLFLSDTLGVPSADDKVGECGWNDSFAPDAACMKSPTVCDQPGQGCLTHPQVCVDFCDAKAYCKHNGRHLCAGPDGQPVDPAQIWSLDVWSRVCQSGGSSFYGDAVKPYCNTLSTGLDSTGPVASFPDCHSPVPGLEGVYDIGGNVSEWVASACEVDVLGKMSCLVRGSNFATISDAQSCALYKLEPITKASPTTGFRCCD